jgi:predicted  nucleic acid-binding Zn-ribbon protein
MLIPRLHEVIGRLQIKGSAFENLQNQILQKKRERADVEEKLKTKGVKLEEVRIGEEMKLEALKTEYANLREASQNFSHEIEEIISQTNVNFI